MNKLKVFNYKISPKTIKRETQWLSVILENISNEPLVGVEVKLNSLTPFFVSIIRPESYISKINPNEIKNIPFQLDARESGKVYITARGNINETEFYWDSPPIKLHVEDQSAEIKNLLILSPPKVPLHKLIKAEATIPHTRQGKNTRFCFGKIHPPDTKKLANRIQIHSKLMKKRVTL